MVSCVIIIIYHNIIIIEIMCTINVMSLNHPRNHPPRPSPSLWKNHFPWNQSLVPKGCCGPLLLNLWSNSPCIKGCCCLVAKSCLTLATPWTVARQAPLFMGFPRQECWSGLPFPSPGDLPNPEIKPVFPALQVDSLPLSRQGSPVHQGTNVYFWKKRSQVLRRKA